MLLLLLACTDYDYAELSQTEVFNQPELSASADVLFVVDNSCSMHEEQERLALNFDAFVEVLSSSYADFQIGVVTTDIDDGGALQGDVYTRDTPELADAFKDTIMVGTRGSKDEKGFESAKLALQGNPNFLRTDARLNLVFLSDEDDHSGAPVSVYLQEFKTMSGTGGFLAHGIVGDEPYGCSAGGTAANAGPRYIEAANTSGGYRDSICAEDYSDVLARIGLQVVGLNDTFALNSLPEPDTLQVWVDRMLMPERDIDGWSYEPGDNAVVFHGRSVPRAGMEIFIEYMPLVGNSTDDEPDESEDEPLDTGI
jgi:hypothetical protein